MVTSAKAHSGDQLRARRRQRIADEIELTALRLFAEHGVNAVTVDDIARAADISRRTFFRYFASKDDLLNGNPERQRDIVCEVAESSPLGTSSRALVRCIILALTSDFDDRREALLLRKRIAAHASNIISKGQGRNPSLIETIIEVVTSHADGKSDSEFQCRVYVHAGFGAMQAAVRTWFAGGTSDSLQDLSAEALNLIGLTAESADQGQLEAD